MLYEQCDPSCIVSNIHVIGGQDSYTGRLEAGTSCVLYLCGQGNLTLIRKKSVATMADTCMLTADLHHLTEHRKPLMLPLTRLSCLSFVPSELDLQSCNSKSLSKDGLLRLQDLKKLKRINLYRVSQITDDVLEKLIQ